MKCTGITSKSKMLAFQKQFLTDAAIGAQFNVTRQAIYQLRKKYGIKETRSTRLKRRNQEIRRLYSKQGSILQIMAIYKLSMTQVYRILHKYK